MLSRIALDRRRCYRYRSLEILLAYYVDCHLSVGFVAHQVRGLNAVAVVVVAEKCGMQK